MSSTLGRRLTAVWFALSLVPAHASLAADEQPAAPQTPVATGGVGSQAERQGEVADARLLRLASEAIRGRAMAGAQARGAAPAVEAIAATSAPAVALRLRVRKDWVEFRQSVAVAGGLEADDAALTERIGAAIERNLAPSALEVPLISQAAARAALRTCDPGLDAAPGTLRPPFYNDDTGVRWLPEANLLVLRAHAVKDFAGNRCVKGVVDLVSGAVTCSEGACWIQ